MILALVSSLLLAAPSAAPPAPAAASPPTQRGDTTVAVRQGQRLEFGLHSGSVTIRTWSRNSVRVSGDADDREAFTLEQRGSVVTVDMEGRHGPPEGDVSLTVPAWMPVTINGVHTDVDIDGVQAAISVETVGGDITVRGGSGIIVLHSVEGSVSLRGARGKMDLGSVNSDITAEDVQGDLAVETTNGDISLTGAVSENADASSVNGDIRYGGPLRTAGRYHFTTHNGDVTLEIPDGTGAVFAVSTFQGDFESDFPVVLREKQGRRFRFTLGDGGARVDLESFQGTIYVARAGSRGNARGHKRK